MRQAGGLLDLAQQVLERDEIAHIAVTCSPRRKPGASQFATAANATAP
jgi:hypothetical protein